jgi:hypothetical protein
MGPTYAGTRALSRRSVAEVCNLRGKTSVIVLTDEGFEWPLPRARHRLQRYQERASEQGDEKRRW